jgi:MFS family permease
VIGIGAAIGAATLEISNTLWFTTLQERVPRDALSRVSAYEWLGSLIFQPLGFVLAGPLAGLFGIRPTLIGAACVLVLSALVVITVPSVRDLRRGEPEHAGEDLAVAV